MAHPPERPSRRFLRIISKTPSYSVSPSRLSLCSHVSKWTEVVKARDCGTCVDAYRGHDLRATVSLSTLGLVQPAPVCLRSDKEVRSSLGAVATSSIDKRRFLLSAWAGYRWRLFTRRDTAGHLTTCAIADQCQSLSRWCKGGKKNLPPLCVFTWLVSVCDSL